MDTSPEPQAVPVTYARADHAAMTMAMETGIGAALIPAGELPLPLPRDLSVATDEKLTEWMNEAAQWLEYIDWREAQTETEEDALQTLLERQQARVVRKMVSAGKSVAAAEREVVLDHDVIEVQDRLLATRDRKRLIAVRSKAFRRRSTVLSRELSRRIGRDPFVHRADGLVA